MIKRLKYISRQTQTITDAELAGIEAVSQHNNRAVGVTGALVRIGDYFFQVLEGPADAVDATFTRIARDPRHADIVVVGRSERVEHRLFGGWDMNVKVLNAGEEGRLEPLGALLDSILELRQRSDHLSLVLQRALLHELHQTGESDTPSPQ